MALLEQWEFMKPWLYGDYAKHIMEKAIENHPTYSRTIEASTQELYDNMGNMTWQELQGTLN
ncbi:MAG: hypothetical protein IJ547_01875, partial [Clostridia bacterium]|nr:hypothetical protein [Clostridia bacterium]